jgi:hypothetical protein
MSCHISDLDSLPSDCPILNVVTIPEVITLGIEVNFFTTRSSSILRTFPFFDVSCHYFKIVVMTSNAFGITWASNLPIAVSQTPSLPLIA